MLSVVVVRRLPVVAVVVLGLLLLGWGLIIPPWFFVHGVLTLPDAIHFAGSLTVGIGFVRRRRWARRLGWWFSAYCFVLALASEAFDLQPFGDPLFYLKSVLPSWVSLGVGIIPVLVLAIPLMRETLRRSGGSPAADTSTDPGRS